MRKWQFQEAKAKLSEVSRCAHAEGPQVITRFGKDDLVVLTKDEYDRLSPERQSMQTDALLSRSRALATDLELDEEDTSRGMMEQHPVPAWRVESSSLERLIERITPENVHTEADWGSDTEREISG